MGFFSWNCRGCGHSIRNPYAINTESAWMGEVVYLESDGSVIKGDYDGYGRIELLGGGILELESHYVCLYHRACYNILKPSKVENSNSAPDQGHFVGEYNPPEPKTLADIERLKKTVGENYPPWAKKS